MERVLFVFCLAFLAVPKIEAAMVGQLEQPAGWPDGNGDVAFIGDLDGDGEATTVAVGDYEATMDGKADAGAVHIVKVDPVQATTSVVSTLGPGSGGIPTAEIGASSYFGLAIASVGKVGGLAGSLLVVGAPWSGEAVGKTHFILLSSAGQGTHAGSVTDGSPGIPSGTLGPSSYFGRSLSFHHDLDGAMVLAVGAYRETGGMGAVHLLSLAITAPATVSATWMSKLAGLESFVPLSLAADDWLGNSVTFFEPPSSATANTWLAAGAINDDTGGTNSGAVYVVSLLSPTNGTLVSKVASNVSTPIAPGDLFGTSLAPLGDLGDGPLLAVGARRDDTGATYSGAIHLITFGATGVVAWAKLANGLSGIPASTFPVGYYFGSFITALHHPDGSGRVGAVLSRSVSAAGAGTQTVVVVLDEPRLDPYLYHTMDGAQSVTNVAASGGETIFLPTADPPLLPWNWLTSSPSLQVIGSSGTVMVPSCSQSLTVCTAPASTDVRANFTRWDGHKAAVYGMVEYVTTRVEAAQQWISGASDGDRIGSSITMLGDVNGDGCNRDFAVGSPGFGGDPGSTTSGSTSAGAEDGAVFILPQPCDGPDPDITVIDMSVVDPFGSAPNSRLGTAVAWVGTTLAVAPETSAIVQFTLLAASAPGADTIFVLQYYLTPTSFVTVEVATQLSPVGGQTQQPQQASGEFGAALAVHQHAPWSDGTRQSTLFAGDPTRKIDGTSQTGPGEVTAYLLQLPTGLSQAATNLASLLPNGTLSNGDRFGAALAVSRLGANPQNQGMQLFVGAPGSQSGTGVVYFLRISEAGFQLYSWSKLANGVAGMPPSTIPSKGRFGSSLAWLGDLDGDRARQEVAVGLNTTQATTFMVLWLDIKTGLPEVFSLVQLEPGVAGLPAAFPVSAGAAIASAGNWEGGGAASDLLVGAPFAGSSGQVWHLRMASRGPGQPPPWGQAQPGIDSIVAEPAEPRAFSVLQLEGTALFDWHPLLWEDSRYQMGSLLVEVDGLNPCLHVRVSMDGATAQCSLSPSLARNRSIEVFVAGSSIAPPQAVLMNRSFAIESVVESGFLSQTVATTRTFRGHGLLSSWSFSSADLVAAGVQLRIGDKYVCDAGDLVQSSNGSSLQCAVPPGVGGPHLVQLELSGTLSPSSATVSYQPAEVQSITPDSVSLSQVEERGFVVNGQNFGSATTEYRLMIGGSECHNSTWVSRTEIRCHSMVVNFTSHDVAVLLLGQPSTGGSGILNYSPLPQVVATGALNLATTGGEEILCFGSNFLENAAIISSVSIGGTECLNWTIQSSAVIECLTPPGTGFDLDVVIKTTTGYTVPSLFPVSYKPPQLTSSSPSSVFADPADTYQITLTGSGFGPANGHQVDALFIGGRRCTQPSVVDDFTVVCNAISGPWAANKVVSITISGQTVSADVIEFQNPPVVTSVSPERLSTAGGTLTIRGSGFGSSVGSIEGISIGGESCTDIQFVSSEEVGCTAPAGTGQLLNVTVRVAQNGISEAVPFVSYMAPEVTAFSSLLLTTTGSTGPPSPSDFSVEAIVFAGDLAADFRIVCAHCGGDLNLVRVSIMTGDGAWVKQCTDLVRVDDGAAWAVQQTLECRHISFADVPTDGPGLGVHAVVEVGGQVSAQVPFHILYPRVDLVPRPEVISILPTSDIPTGGSLSSDEADLIQVQGNYFGFAAYQLRSVEVGGVACPTVAWQSDTLLYIAAPPGIGVGHVVVVTTLGGLSNFEGPELSYLPAAITSLSPSYALTGVGLQSFEIRGANFGNEAADLGNVTIGGQPCKTVEWMSASLIRCNNVSRAHWSSSAVEVVVGGQPAEANAAFEPIGRPLITVLSPPVASVGASLLILGENFGHDVTDISNVTVNGRVCRELVHRSPTALGCLMPSSDPAIELVNLRNVPVVVTSNGGQSSESATISYTGSGTQIAEVPTFVQAWRPVGQAESIEVRWVFPNDSSMPDVEDIETFDILFTRVGSEDSQVVSVRVGDMEDDGIHDRVLDTEDGSRIFWHPDFVFTSVPVTVQVRAVNPSGPGLYSNKTAPVAANCQFSQFLQTQTATEDWACLACPVGAFCGGSDPANVTAMPGYWRVPWSPGGLEFYECPRGEACSGYDGPGIGILLNRSLSLFRSGATAGPNAAAARALAGRRRQLAGKPQLGASLAADQPPTALPVTAWGDPEAMEGCAPGYYGTMCTSCRPGYTRWGDFGCNKCRSDAAVGLAFIGLLLLVFVVLSYLIVAAIRAGTERTPVGTAAIKITYSHIQTVAIATSFNLKWPDVAMRLFSGMSAASSVSSEVLGFDCMMDDRPAEQGESRFFVKAALILLVPPLMVAAAALFWFGSSLCCQPSTPGAEEAEEPDVAASQIIKVQPTPRAAAADPEAGVDRQSSSKEELVPVSASVMSLRSTNSGNSQPAPKQPSGALPKLAARAGGSAADSAVVGRDSLRKPATTANGAGAGPGDQGVAVQAVAADPAPEAALRGAAWGGEASVVLAESPADQDKPTKRSKSKESVNRQPSSRFSSFLIQKFSIHHEHIGIALTTWDKLLTSVVVILFLVHMSVTTTSMQLLTCRDVGRPATALSLEQPRAPAAEAGFEASTHRGCNAEQTHRRLVQDLEICCYDPAALRNMYGLGLPGLFIYAFGIPIVGGLLLWWRRDTLHTRYSKATLGFLYVGFRDKAYYWESVIALRKVLVAVIAVALEPMGVTLQTYTALVLIFILGLVHARLWPYSTAMLNWLELGALMTAYGTFECGLFLSDDGTSDAVRLLATLAILFLNLAFLAIAVVLIVREKMGCGRKRIGAAGVVGVGAGALAGNPDGVLGAML